MVQSSDNCSSPDAAGTAIRQHRAKSAPLPGVLPAVVVVVALAGALAGAPLPLAADGPISSWLADERNTLQAPSTELDVDQAAQRAQQRHGGQLISIRPAEQDGQHGWQATVLLDNGRVKTLFVEARTGAVVDRRRRH